MPDRRACSCCAAGLPVPWRGCAGWTNVGSGFCGSPPGELTCVASCHVRAGAYLAVRCAQLRKYISIRSHDHWRETGWLPILLGAPGGLRSAAGIITAVRSNLPMQAELRTGLHVRARTDYTSGKSVGGSFSAVRQPCPEVHFPMCARAIVNIANIMRRGGLKLLEFVW